LPAAIASLPVFLTVTLTFTTLPGLTAFFGFFRTTLAVLRKPGSAVLPVTKVIG